MKRACQVLAIVSVLALPVVASSQNEMPWEKKLPFENATITYKITGVESGEEVVYLRDYGKLSATYHETTMKMMGMVTKDSSVEFEDPDYVYTYDLQVNEGFKGINPQKAMIEEFNKLSGADQKKVRQNAQKMGGAYAEGVGGQVEENAVKILGYNCDRVDIMGGASMYVIHGTDVPLKTDINMMGMKMTTEAVSLDRGKIDDKYFQHPKGITAASDPELDIMSKRMAKRTIAVLQDPSSADRQQVDRPGALQMPSDMTEEDKQMMQQAEQMMKGFQDMFKQ